MGAPGRAAEHHENHGDVRVFIVADLRLLRDGLTNALAREDGVSVVGSAASLADAMAAIPSARPSVILIDLTPAEDLDAIGRLATCQDAKVVALGVPDLEAEILACAEAGAAAYVTREQSLRFLVETILAVERGEAICSARMAASLLHRVATLAGQRTRGVSGGVRLTERELEIASLIDHGLSNKQIADRLCIEVSTVKNHVHNILEKLNVRSRGEAAARLRGRFSGPDPVAHPSQPVLGVGGR
jgi:DNA-binding NarL/FixJ family response regulator